MIDSAYSATYLWDYRCIHGFPSRSSLNLTSPTRWWTTWSSPLDTWGVRISTLIHQATTIFMLWELWFYIKYVLSIGFTVTLGLLTWLQKSWHVWTKHHVKFFQSGLGHVSADKQTPSAIDYLGHMKEAVELERRQKSRPLKDMLSGLVSQYNKMATQKRHRIDAQKKSLVYNMRLG